MAWSIAAAPRGSRPDFTLRREPPNSYTTRAQQWLVEQLLLLEPGTQDGGGYTPKRGYHGTREQNDRWDAADGRTGSDRDYSVRDAEDRRGPGDKTAARDWTHPDAHGGDYQTMAKYGDRLEAAYGDRDPRLAGWREALGQTDLDAPPEGLDFRYWFRRRPDDSHMWHWHFSEDRGQVESFANKWALLTVLAGWSVAEWRRSIEEEDMPTVPEIVTGLLTANVGASGPNVGRHLEETRDTVITLPGKLDQLAGQMNTVLAAVLNVDEEVLAKLGSAEMTADQVADLLRPVLGDRAEQVGLALAGIG